MIRCYAAVTFISCLYIIFDICSISGLLWLLLFFSLLYELNGHDIKVMTIYFMTFEMNEPRASQHIFLHETENILPTRIESKSNR